MAREVQVLVNITSDLSGKPIDNADDNYEPFRFSVDALGSFEVDLTSDEINELNKLLAPYIAAARTPEQKAPAKRRPRGELTAVRSWAAQNGFSLSDRGRIPEEVTEAYNKAQAPTFDAADAQWPAVGEEETPETPEPIIKGKASKTRNPDGSPAD